MNIIAVPLPDCNSSKIAVAFDTEGKGENTRRRQLELIWPAIHMTQPASIFRNHIPDRGRSGMTDEMPENIVIPESPEPVEGSGIWFSEDTQYRVVR